ncbi:HET domain-containing protein [Candidatus Bathyarchaeota archaeon]|nr:HET domain-containing protein [Candidatus Bathyarchaeota archaeon]
MKGAIAQCVSECPHADAGGFLPTRLLDLGPEANSSRVRLVASSGILSGPNAPSEVPKYAALSYCWGPPAKGAQPCTTKGNLEARKTDIAKITPVLRDAMRVCRSLGVRYLWVDALCIVQDDVADWERESVSMAHVYECAMVTICTPISTTCWEGFLDRDRRLISVPFDSCLLPGISGSYSLVASGTCRDRALIGWPNLDINHSVWASRGWTLQENLMSVRRLVFGQSMIHFQCGNIGVSENGCKHDEEGGNFFEPSTAKDLSDYHDEWDALILEAYGKRSYTMAQDRLPGISGMAKRIAELCGDEYLAGLWRADMPYALVWYAYVNANPGYHVEMHELVDRLCSPSPYITPSWSPMRLAGVRIERGLRHNTDPGFFRDLVSAECTVLEARAASTGLNPFGRLQDGLLRIRGRFRRVPSDMRPLECHAWPPRLLCVEDQGLVVAYCNIDCQPKGPVPQGELSMLLVASTGGSPSWRESMHRQNFEPGSNCPCGDPNTGAAASPSSHGSDASGEDSGSEDEGERDAWGLLLHPAKERGKFVRVGVWASVSGDGAGMGYFERFESREVEIV